VKAWFVIGTDTNVGKTAVSVALLRAAGAAGLRTLAMKPVESGCPRASNGELVPDDATQLCSAASLVCTVDEICLYRYAAPVAPAVAAAREGDVVDPGRILARFRSLQERRPDLFLVEGAGGLLVPVRDDLLIADLCALLQLPVLVVARDGLGTINHTGLTVEVARSRGLTVAGVVLNGAQEATEPEAVASNAREIERLAQVKVLGALPRVADVGELAQLVESHLETGVLWG
jgi:dethiobiotin synthetase